MPPPNDTDLPPGVYLVRYGDGRLELSDALIMLLVHSRSNYDWPAGTGALQSQQTILALEACVTNLRRDLTPDNAHAIICQVSKWAGNRPRVQADINNADAGARVQMQQALELVQSTESTGQGLDALSRLDGVSMIIASKIYRFCCPQYGAAVDRHASYFFNSLVVVHREPEQESTKATYFRREWARLPTGPSRLAIYTARGYIHNRNQFIDVYLPLLSKMAGALNARTALYTCATRSHSMRWRPTDVEMAAYYWWAQNGQR